MPNDWFRFKQFLVRQDRCAMKVGTDGILLGAWCNVNNCDHILDVGTGTGLIALMCAQRSNANIIGIEIDSRSADQAGSNFRDSKWSDRLELINEDFRKTSLLPTGRFDLLVCNPPFFKNSLLGLNSSRNIVRHELDLDLVELFSKGAPLLRQEGRISLILPCERFDEADKLATLNGLYLMRKTDVFPRVGVKPLRILAEWSKVKTKEEINTIIIHQDTSNEYHPDFVSLTKEFYMDSNKGMKSS